MKLSSPRNAVDLVGKVVELGAPDDDRVVARPAGAEEDVADARGAVVARRAEVHQRRVDRRLQVAWNF